MTSDKEEEEGRRSKDNQSETEDNDMPEAVDEERKRKEVNQNKQENMMAGQVFDFVYYIFSLLRCSIGT